MVINSTQIEFVEFGEISNASNNSETLLLDEKNAKSRIAVIVIPVLVVVLILIGFSAIIIWNVWRHKRKSVAKFGINSSFMFSAQRSELNLGHSAMLEGRQSYYREKAQQFMKNPEDFIGRPTFDNEVQTAKSKILVQHRRPFTDQGEESTSLSTSPPLFVVKRKLLRKRRYRADLIKGPFDERHARRSLNTVQSLHVKRDTDSGDTGSTAYPTSDSSRRPNRRRVIKRRIVTPRSVWSARSLARERGLMDSRCDCHICSQQSLNSSLAPNFSSGAPTESGGRTRRKKFESFPDKQAKYDVDEDVRSDEKENLEKEPSSELSHHPSTIKSAPTVIGGHSSPHERPDLIGQEIPRTANLRAFSNSNCFPSAWDYEPGGYRDYKMYKNKLADLKRMQYYYGQSNSRRTDLYGVQMFESKKESREKMSTNSSKACQLVYFKSDKKTWVAIKDRFSSNVRIVPAEWLLDSRSYLSEESCSSCDSSCGAFQESDDSDGGCPKNPRTSHGRVQRDFDHRGRRSKGDKLPLNLRGSPSKVYARHLTERGFRQDMKMMRFSREHLKNEDA